MKNNYLKNFLELFIDITIPKIQSSYQKNIWEILWHFEIELFQGKKYMEPKTSVNI